MCVAVGLVHNHVHVHAEQRAADNAGACEAAKAAPDSAGAHSRGHAQPRQGIEVTQ